MILVGFLSVSAAHASSLTLRDEPAQQLVQVLKASNVPAKVMIENEIVYNLNSIDCRLKQESPIAAFLPNCDLNFYFVGKMRSVRVPVAQFENLVAILQDAGVPTSRGWNDSSDQFCEV